MLLYATTKYPFYSLYLFFHPESLLSYDSCVFFTQYYIVVSALLQKIKATNRHQHGVFEMNEDKIIKLTLAQ